MTKMSMLGLAVIASVLGGCVVRPDAPAGATVVVPGGMPAQTGTSLVQIVNNSPNVICYARFSPASEPNWTNAQDALGQDTIPAGQSHQFPLPGGTWDVMLEACGQGDSPFGHPKLLEQRYQIPAGGNFVLAYPAQ